MFGCDIFISSGKVVGGCPNYDEKHKTIRDISLPPTRSKQNEDGLIVYEI